MILAVDVHYDNHNGLVAGVAFKWWTDAEPDERYITRVEQVSDYVPGQFYQRELPGILKLLSEHGLQPEYIVIDSYVYLDGNAKPGLSKHLYDALQGKVKVIGVAKKRFAGISETYALYRGKSKQPLYITSAGEALSAAKWYILSMCGIYRIPTILKKADQLSRLN
ncbi:endonuclease V [Nitrosomonas sp. Nm34]|uniref:endonuclease V n=1 Tax=Nitrosomonas sp. Nm34 TaxID=1881055 RepID=UPI0008EAB61E|nr:endonuclease V [Nitrosomonas sp. Nm34]SFI44077.1 deoxyribonuclease V [Nitrosomonas sp. Nm34]